MMGSVYLILHQPYYDAFFLIWKIKLIPTLSLVNLDAFKDIEVEIASELNNSALTDMFYHYLGIYQKTLTEKAIIKSMFLLSMNQ